jgi:FkbM family methyltransferase
MRAMQNTSFLNNLIRGFSKRSAKLFHDPYRRLNINPIKLKYLKHLPPGKHRTHKMLDGVLHYMNAQELLHAIKEIFIDEVYKVQLSPAPTIIDCGANIGLSVIYLKKLFPNAHITAFEPDKTNFGLLQKNMYSFHLNDVKLEQKAVWKENTVISFVNEGSMSSRIEQTSSSNDKVTAVKLKDYLNRNIDFLKVDIEGAEYEVLKDIESNLNVVENMFFEYHGNFNQNKELVEILDIINRAGFSFYIKEASSVYNHPFMFSQSQIEKQYDIQLNIFCFRA